MGLINPDQSGIVDGAVGDAADWTTPMNTIINAINGNLDNANIAAGSAIEQAKFAGTTLDYAQITTDATQTATTATLVAGLSVTVTIPAGGRRVRITAYVSNLRNQAASKDNTLTIWDGTVGSGTLLNRGVFTSTAADSGCPMTVQAIVTPASGSKTYNVGLHTSTGGTADISAGATFPAFIHVELI